MVIKNTKHLTNALRRIRNAWHFYLALILVIKVVCGSIVLRCSPLKRALCNKWSCNIGNTS
ncbi:DUF3265 domain-containing protein [Vibrio parahaemolyticus]|nr:DUF3265 domain-containing protein [Vibrio parahaemolyticus]EGR0257192.1 DUF3265 domain-containing protein [Vibrio parahaemolyticus]EJB0375991.1 DUF3265 domain-containing protein [Vibrio parahaemolyticus]EJG2058027.1 DUF3265 domain-containing protein [Vibrio parahaemolyticus]ELH3765727.1 DUF3265 domain-containing protein [Vibrio parahaemolyticus]